MKAVITGGAGFIGANLCRLLGSRGHQMIVLDSLVSGDRSNLDSVEHVKFCEADVRNFGAVQAACEGADVLFHLAASVGNKRSIDDPFTDASVNAIGTVNVMEAVRREGISRVVISSSAGTFGELRTLPISEDHPVEPDSPYGASKLFEEKFALSYGKLYPINVVALRYFNVYGPLQRFDAYGNVIPIFAYRMLRKEPLIVFGDGEQTRDFVHVADVAEANYLGVTAVGASGPFNLGSGSRITINALIELMQEVSGIRAEIEFGPPRLGDVRDSMADISRASGILGFEPKVGLYDGLKEYMHWLAHDLERNR